MTTVSPSSLNTTVRRRSVKFAEKPPTILRYSYHGSDINSNPSTSLFFSKLQQVMNNSSSTMPRTRDDSNVCLRKNKITVNSNRHSSYEPTYANLNNHRINDDYENFNVKLNNNHLYDNVPKLLSHRWSNNYGCDTVDVIQKNNGITHVTINDFEYQSDDDSEEMAMHLYDCIEQFNTACDKILGARQMIDSDTTLSTSDREKLLRLVSKSIIQGKNRLEGIDSSRTVSSITGGSSTSMSSKIQSSSPTVSNVEPKIQIDNNFMNKYGPQIMQLLQHNMAKQN